MNSATRSLVIQSPSASFSLITQLPLSRSSQHRHFLAVYSSSIHTSFRRSSYFVHSNIMWSPVSSLPTPQCLQPGSSAFPILYLHDCKAPLLVQRCEYVVVCLRF